MVEDRLLNWLEMAIAMSATDIHCHFQEQKSTLQLRTITGLKELYTIKEDHEVYQLLKYKANLNLSVSMIPQTGTFEYIVHNKVWYCRFSAMETLNAKSGVLRILNLSPIKNLEDLSFQSSKLDTIKEFIQQDNGLILFSGATGSGKSTTMFTALKEVKYRSIYSIEDPIERIYDYLMQMQVNLTNGFDFQIAIKQLLRHDPDIIVIGEIRSPLEAQAAIRACLSGHLVCATIHSSSLKQTIYRLLDFDISLNDLEILNLHLVFQKLIYLNNQRSAQFEVANASTSLQIIEAIKKNT